MFSIAVCDDNNAYLSLFKKVVKNQFQTCLDGEPSFSVDASFDNGADLLEYADTHRIDILFLDIDMPEMTGFEIAKRLNKKFHGEILIVFMSAYDNFVYESFDYLPFAYLRKESISEDLPKVVFRICDVLSSKTRTIDLLCDKHKLETDSREIMYFESKKNYFEAHLTDGKVYSCRGTLAKLEDDMRSLGFFRVHNAYIVNLEHIDRVIDNKDIMIGALKIPIAQKRKKEFKEAYFEYTRRRMGA